MEESNDNTSKEAEHQTITTNIRATMKDATWRFDHGVLGTR